MKVYGIANDAWQGVTITVDTKKVNLSIYWVESLGWVVDIDGVVTGVAIHVSLPIFKQYGYPGIFFAGLPDIERDGLSDRVLVSADESELEDKIGIVVFNSSGRLEIE